MGEVQDSIVFLSGAFIGVGVVVALALSVLALRAGLRGFPWKRK